VAILLIFNLVLEIIHTIRWRRHIKAIGFRVNFWWFGRGMVAGVREGYKKVINYRGPIGYNDEQGVYLKWGKSMETSERQREAACSRRRSRPAQSG
jgi:hypothetical protein